MKTRQTYYRALISAPSKREAFRLLEALTKDRLVAGGLVTSGESLYWWRQKRVSKRYWNLSVFTTGRHQKKIISLAKKLQNDQVPIIAFFKIELADADFLNWVRDSVSA